MKTIGLRVYVEAVPPTTPASTGTPVVLPLTRDGHALPLPPRTIDGHLKLLRPWRVVPSANADPAVIVALANTSSGSCEKGQPEGQARKRGQQEVVPSLARRAALANATINA